MTRCYEANSSYNPDLDQLDVTPGQAFTNEEFTARLIYRRQHPQQVEYYTLKENVLRIRENNGFTCYLELFIDGLWQLDTNWFVSYDEAYEYAWGLLALLEWMNGFNAVIQPSPTRHDLLLERGKAQDQIKRYELELQDEGPLCWPRMYQSLRVAQLREIAKERQIDAKQTKKALVALMIAMEEEALIAKIERLQERVKAINAALLTA